MIYKILLMAALLSSVSMAEFIKLAPKSTQEAVSEKNGKIHWKESYHKALESALKENKPVLFIISRHTCKYCVVLEENALSDVSVIKTLNENFIAHTAYTDDGDYYPQELWAGGTPMIWFLLPSGEPMFQPIPGAIPTEGFKEALDIVMKAFDDLQKDSAIKSSK
jgi:uncharacterized protein YyaL (SSP411 family)